MNDIKDTILERIKTGDVSMQPRWRFAVRAVGTLLALLVVALLSVYLASFVMFVLYRSGLMFAPLYGLAGLLLFAVMSPWILIILVLISLLAFYLLVSHYRFSYRRPLAYTMLGVVGFVTVFSSGIYALALHERFESVVDDYRVPGMAPLYKTMSGTRPEGIELGMVLEKLTEGCQMQTEDEDTVVVITTPRTRVAAADFCRRGNVLLIFGPRTGDTITAFGIRPAPRDFPQPRHMHVEGTPSAR